MSTTFTCRVYYDPHNLGAQMMLEVISLTGNEHAAGLAKEEVKKMGWIWEECTSPDSELWHQGDD